MGVILDLVLRPESLRRYTGPDGEARYDFGFRHSHNNPRADHVLLKGLAGMLPVSGRGKVYRLTLEERDDPAAIPEGD